MIALPFSFLLNENVQKRNLFGLFKFNGEIDAIVTAVEVLFYCWYLPMNIYFVKKENFSVEKVTLDVFNINFSTSTFLWTLFQLVWEFSALKVFAILHLQERHTKATYI